MPTFAKGLRLCCSWPSRLQGLLGTDCDAAPIVLAGCRSVHTWGMRYPLDLAFVAHDGRVLKAPRAVPPGRMLRCAGAVSVVERPSSKDPWPKEGDMLSLCLVSGGSGDGERGHG